MSLTFLALETGAVAGIAFLAFVVVFLGFVFTSMALKRAARARALRELAEREGWSFRASDRDVARCLSQCPYLYRPPRSLVTFRKGELAITLGDVTVGRKQRRRRSRNQSSSTAREASFCQIEGPGLAAPSLSLMKKPEIPPALAKLMGSLANFDVEGLMNAASLALPDDPEGFSKAVMIEGADAEGARAFLTRERREKLRPIVDEHGLIALREGALVLVSKEPVPAERARGFSEQARALFETLSSA